MTRYYVKIPTEIGIDLSQFKHFCGTDKKSKIVIDPSCKCGKVPPKLIRKAETVSEEEARRRYQKSDEIRAIEQQERALELKEREETYKKEKKSIRNK
jgi:hypothetical protein